MKPSEILDRGADILSETDRWTRGENARDVFGNPQESVSRDAVCWCAEGVLESVDPEDWSKADRYMRRVVWNSDSEHLQAVFYWNDAPNRTQAEVVAAMRKAADVARSEGQ